MTRVVRPVIKRATAALMSRSFAVHGQITGARPAREWARSSKGARQGETLPLPAREFGARSPTTTIARATQR